MSATNEGKKAVAIMTEEMNRKFSQYFRESGWTAKNPDAIESTLRRFYEWGYTDGAATGIDIGNKAARGIPLRDPQPPAEGATESA